MYGAASGAERISLD